MKAFLSGEAAKIVIVGKPHILCEANSDQTKSIDPMELHLVFGGCTDVITIDVKTVKAAQSLVQEAWSCDRALRLFLLLIDPLEPSEELVEYAECAEELLVEQNVIEFLLNRLTSKGLGQLVEMNRVMAATEGTPVVRSILARVISGQHVIQRVATCFEMVHEEKFGGNQEKIDCYSALVNHGVFRELTTALLEGGDISFLRIQAISKFRRYAAAISVWTAMLQTGLTKVALPKAADNDIDAVDQHDYYDTHSDKWQPERGRAALESVIAQRALIVSELKLGHLDRARNLADQLVIEQQSISKAEHIAKTLDFLAQEAKELGATGLQLEWADRAYRFNPGDPLTSGHHADALIGVGRFIDAEEAISSTEALGNVTFAGNMRARILRLKGRYEEAREKYLATADAHPGDPEIWRSYVGAVECLRDSNRIDEARREYEGLARRWPSNPTLSAGLASTLMEAGDFANAVKNFGIAIKNNGGTVPKSGRANAYKLAGNYDEAIKLYDECAAEAPNNEAVFCGRAEVFRAKGDLEAALAAFELAIERAPFSTHAIVGKAEVLEELKRLPEAEEAYKFGSAKFPEHEAFEIGLARLMRRTHAAPEALAAFDRLLSDLPENRWVAFSRADLLRRVGQPEAALRALDMIIEKWPTFGTAINARISILIGIGQLTEAKLSLSSEPPLSALDWRQVILRAMLLKAEGDTAAGFELLSDAAKSVPFARERKLIKAALAIFHLESGQYGKAFQSVEEGGDIINNVIALHAYAVSPFDVHRRRASRMFDDIIGSGADADIIDISQEIAKRFRIVQTPPDRSLGWIVAAERSLLLREAG